MYLALFGVHMDGHHCSFCRACSLLLSDWRSDKIKYMESQATWGVVSKQHGGDDSIIPGACQLPFLLSWQNACPKNTWEKGRFILDNYAGVVHGAGIHGSRSVRGWSHRACSQETGAMDLVLSWFFRFHSVRTLPREWHHLCSLGFFSTQLNLFENTHTDTHTESTTNLNPAKLAMQIHHYRATRTWKGWWLGAGTQL